MSGIIVARRLHFELELSNMNTESGLWANKLSITGAILCIAIFISDIFTPLGIADGISYIIVVLLSLWMRGTKSTLIAALATSLLTLSGILFSPEGEKASIFLTNRLLSLLAIWSSAFVILKYKNSESDAARHRDRLKALFEYAIECIVITDGNGKIKMINPKAEKEFGYNSGELENANLQILLPDKEVEATLAQSENDTQRNKGIIKELELKGRKKNNHLFPVEVRLSSYLLDNELNFIIFINDITVRKKQEEFIRESNSQLRMYTRQLKETNSELESFAYISSHDLQEPLRKIQSFGERLLAGESDKLSDKGKEYLNRILNASERMQRLINDLLSFSRLTSKARSFEPVNLNTIVEEVLSDLEISIRQNQASIQQLSNLPVIEADPTQMRQLFQNLIANAIKFKKDDLNPEIKIYSVQRLGQDGQSKIEINIEDNGIGFDEKYLNKIFTIFQRLESKKYNGSGIGLSICKKIVSRHNGEITAVSRAGAGSRFIVTLPFSQKKDHQPEMVEIENLQEHENK